MTRRPNPDELRTWGIVGAVAIGAVMVGWLVWLNRSPPPPAPQPDGGGGSDDAAPPFVPGT